MTLYSTKYINNSRSVSGTVTVQDNDCILACVTTDAAVTINLPSIPSGNWNTNWKIYVYDASGNAATNNITLVAGTGQTINGASTLVISTNSARLVVRISSNSSFNALTSYSGGVSQAYTTIEDEGVALTQRTIMNFVGSGVSAVDSGGKTVITISGISLVSLTNAALNTLITNGTVVPAQLYLVTDATYTNGGVVVTGITTASVSTSGVGIFLNADYQGVGVYTGVSGYNSWQGIWSSDSQAVTAGDVVIYNNNHYKNLTGSWGTAPSGDAVNWVVLSRTVTTGFILECDFVIYNISSNQIEHREDKRRNSVGLYVSGGRVTLSDFQWGRDACTDNKVCGETVLTSVNSCATVKRNVLINAAFTETTKRTESGSVLDNFVSKATLVSTNTRGVISNNTITSGGALGINFLDFNCECKHNVVESSGTISFGNSTNSTSTINKNRVSEGGSIIFASADTSTATINENVISQSGYVGSTATVTTLNFSNNTVTNGTITFAGANSGSIIKCSLFTSVTISLTQLTTAREGYTCSYGFSNWQENLDFSTALSGTALTIPSAYTPYVGVFVATNVTGSGVTSIIQPPTNHPFILTADSSSYFDINDTAIASATTDQILLSHASPTSPATVTGRTNGSDSIVLKRFGTLNGIIEFNIWR